MKHNICIDIKPQLIYNAFGSSAKRIHQAIIRLVHPVHEIYHHFMRFMQSKGGDHKYSMYSPCLQFVWARNMEFTEEFNLMTEFEMWEELLEDIPMAMVSSKLIGALFHHIGLSYCEYHRRIGSKVASYPMRWFILGRAPHDDDDAARRIVCTELLSLPKEELGDVIVKLVYGFGDEIELGASTGKIPKAFRDEVVKVGDSLQISSEEIEGCMNTLRMHYADCLSEEISVFQIEFNCILIFH